MAFFRPYQRLPVTDRFDPGIRRERAAYPNADEGWSKFFDVPVDYLVYLAGVKDEDARKTFSSFIEGSLYKRTPPCDFSSPIVEPAKKDFPVPKELDDGRARGRNH